VSLAREGREEGMLMRGRWVGLIQLRSWRSERAGVGGLGTMSCMEERVSLGELQEGDES
jgi:hypothetical protein